MAINPGITALRSSVKLILEAVPVASSGYVMVNCKLTLPPGRTGSLINDLLSCGIPIIVRSSEAGFAVTVLPLMVPVKKLVVLVKVPGA